MKLTDEQRKVILSRVESLFEETKAKLLGRYFKGPKMIFQISGQVDPFHTIEGIYTYTLNMLYGTGIKPRQKLIEDLAHVTGNYIDAQQLKVKNHILSDVANAKTPSEAIRSIRGTFDKAGKYLDMLVTSEAKITQAYASREGISQLSADIGDHDPTVVFRGVIDSKICKYCKQMYHDSNNLAIPKPYKLSQVRDGYFKAKEWDGKSPYYTAHPNCRHSVSYIPKNFGVNVDGTIEFKSFGYDYYKDYWSMKKDEDLPIESLVKSEFYNYDEYLELNIDHEGHKSCGPGCNHL